MKPMPRPSILSVEPYVGGESKVPGVNRIDWSVLSSSGRLETIFVTPELRDGLAAGRVRDPRHQHRARNVVHPHVEVTAGDRAVGGQFLPKLLAKSLEHHRDGCQAVPKRDRLGLDGQGDEGDERDHQALLPP